MCRIEGRAWIVSGMLSNLSEELSIFIPLPPDSIYSSIPY